MLGTTLFEEKQFLGKSLICDFHVSNINFKIKGFEITTNKWLQVFEWELIYEKLDDILKKTKEVNLFDLDMSSFRIDNYIEVYLKKAAVQGKPFATILGRKENEIAPVYLKIYIKRLSSCKEELPEIREIEIETTPPSQPLEYDPTAVNGSNGSNLAYTPSNISNSEEAYTPSKLRSDASSSSNSYVPKPISPPKRDYISSPEISVGTLPPQYKASKIRARSQSPKTPAKKKKVPVKEEERSDRPKRVASARKDQPKRSTRSDDEDEESKASKKKKENVTVRKIHNPPPVDQIQVTKIDDVWKSGRSAEKERSNRDREREPSSCSSSSSSSSKKKSSKDRHRDKNSEGSSSKKDIRHFMSPIAEKTSKVDKNELKVSEVPYPLSKAEKEQKKIEEMQRLNAIFSEINTHAENEKKRRPKPPRDEFLSYSNW